MFDITLRRWKDTVISPVVALVPSQITPGHVTAAAFVCGLIACALAASEPGSLSAVAFWAVNRLLDCIDGALARKRGCATELGGFLDILNDFVVYSLLPIGVAHGQDRLSLQEQIYWPAVAWLEASFHVNNFILFYIAAVAGGRQPEELTSVSMQPALIEGFEARLLFTAMLIWPSYSGVLSWAMAAGVAVRCAQRVSRLVPALRKLNSKPK